MSEMPMASAETTSRGTPVDALLLIIGAIAVGAGVFLAWIKLSGASVKIDFAGGAIRGQQVPPIHVTRALPFPGSPTAKAWDIGPWITITLLVVAVVMLVLGAIVLLKQVEGSGLGAIAPIMAVLAVVVCAYVLLRKNSLVHSAANAAFKQKTGQDLDSFINKAISSQGITGLTAQLQFATSLQIGFFISALGVVVALIGGVLGMTSSGGSAVPATSVAAPEATSDVPRASLPMSPPAAPPSPSQPGGDQPPNPYGSGGQPPS